MAFKTQMINRRVLAGVMALALMATAIVAIRDSGARAQPTGDHWPATGCDYADPEYPASGFADVEPGAFYATAVDWAKASNITTGTGAGSFAPLSAVTRAQMAAFLWRMVCTPTGAPDPGFDDVPAGQYYTQAVAWLGATGITTGTGPKAYSPGEVVTRAQMAAFLWRLAGQPTGSPSSGFDDVAAGQYYTDAVNWLKANGITTGVSETQYAPGAAVSRSQMVTFLYRFALRTLFVGVWNLDGNGQLSIYPGPADEQLAIGVLDQCSPNPCNQGTGTASVRTDHTAAMDLTDTDLVERSYSLLLNDGGTELTATVEHTYPDDDPRRVNCTTSRYRRAPAKGDLTTQDYDCDGVPVDVDNCPGAVEGINSFTANPDQGDRDSDGTGDLCDTTSVRITSASLAGDMLPIGGGPTDYKLGKERGVDAPTTLTIQTWIQQGDARRAAGSQVINCASPSCISGGALTVSNSSTGKGKLVPGPAVVQFQLKEVDDILHEVERAVELLALPAAAEEG